MSDPFSWSVRLGRWFGVDVRLHVLLVAFFVLQLLDAALADPGTVVSTAAWLGLLLVALGLHEFGHIVAARRLGTEPDEVRLWPLGNLILPGQAAPSLMRPAEAVVIASSGLIVSGTLALSAAIALRIVGDARMVFYPFGNALGTAAPILADGKTPAAAFTAVWWVGWFGYLNWILFLANLIPAQPMDMGRILRGLTESPWSGPSGRDNLVATWCGRGASILLVLFGLGWFVTGTGAGLWLVALGVFLYAVARMEHRTQEEGAFFEDSLFGYDFSQGYTSLEAGAATVRPTREGALTRWRRRRSEQRKRRADTRVAAEEQRMDEILAKLHERGRGALTGEEQRFLVRVSARYRSRPRPAS
jgi:Zn-dependent protease